MRVSESFATPLLRSARKTALGDGQAVRRGVKYLAVGLALAASAAMLVLWAFVVPIFQSPDEPVHTDYALSILTAGHLIHARDGVGARVANNFTTYLIDSTDFYRVAFHGSMRVPPNYGSPAYFTALDKDAPTLQAVKREQQRSGKVNWLTAVYPFAYYALEAVVMGTVYHASASITSAFFAGRLFSVALTLAGLLLGYRIARMAGLRPAVAVAFIAAVGLFPLTSFIGSYIQPDNLGFFAVALSVYACMRCVKKPGYIEYSLLGFSLALLLLSKVQYFLPAACAALFSVVALWGSHRIRAGVIFRAIGCLAIPIIAAALFSHEISSQSSAQRLAGLHSDFSFVPLHKAAAAGLPHLAAFLGAAVWHGFNDYFVSGQSWQSYWGTFGWLDVQMLFVDRQWTGIVHVAIVVLTLLTMALCLFAVVRNLRRLIAVARGRGVWSAARIASRAVPFNSFVLFIAVMMILYVATGNVFGAQGRNWYPFIIPSFLCFVLVAPEATRRLKARSYLRAGAAALFVCYSLAATPMALATIENRYYGFESLAPDAFNLKKALAASTVPNLGVIDGATCANFDAGARHCLQAAGLAVDISGWAIDARQKDIGSAIFVIVDRHTAIRAAYDLARNDVAAAFHNDGYRNAGFAAMIPGDLLRSPGIHQVQVVEVLANENTYRNIGPPLKVGVSPIKVSHDIKVSGAVTQGFIDGVSPTADIRTHRVTMALGQTLRLSGWALGPHNVQYGAIIITANGHALSRATYPLARPDVASALHEPLPQVGFTASIDSAQIGVGAHELRVVAVSAGSKSYYQVGESIPVVIVR